MKDEKRPVTMIDHEIDHAFTYHPPKPEDVQRYANLREAAKNLALFIAEICPPSPDRTIAIRKVREAVMYANASIALDGRSPR